MNLMLIIFCLLLVPVISNYQTHRGTRVECNEAIMDECFANFLVLCNNSIKFPETVKELKPWCSNDRPRINKCIKDYLTKCVNVKTLKVSLNLMRRSLNDYYKSVCSSDINTDRRLSLSKCWNSLKPGFLLSCHSVYYDRLVETLRIPRKDRFASICCHYWEFMNCGVELIRNVAKGSAICNYGHSIDFESINKALVITLRCGKNHANSESCERIVSTAKRVRHPEEYYKHRSAIPLFIKIATSL